MASPIPYEDIKAIVDYDYGVEEADYEQQDEDGRRNHIFVCLRRVREWLESEGRDDDD
jgi:hypothetical protein